MTDNTIEEEKPTLQHMIHSGNDNDLPIQEFEAIFIEACQRNGCNPKQGFKYYLTAYFERPPAEFTERECLSETEFLDSVVIPRFTSEWARCEKDRTRDWIECSHCHELLHPDFFQKFSIQIKGVTDICNKCSQYVGHFNRFKSKE